MPGLEADVLLKPAKGKDLFPFRVADVDQYLIYCHADIVTNVSWYWGIDQSPFLRGNRSNTGLRLPP